MYDTGKIMAGVGAFLVIITSPVWYNMVSGKAGCKVEPKIVTKEKRCVESREYMRTEHMQLLLDWRDRVVREGKRTYTGLDKREHNISLTNTCLKCHPNKADFCDKCHNYLIVTPVCWTCHVIPKEKKQ